MQGFCKRKNAPIQVKGERHWQTGPSFTGPPPGKLRIFQSSFCLDSSESIYTYIYIYIHTHTHIHISYIYIHTVYIDISTYINIDTYRRIYIYIHATCLLGRVGEKAQTKNKKTKNKTRTPPKKKKKKKNKKPPPPKKKKRKKNTTRGPRSASPKRARTCPAGSWRRILTGGRWGAVGNLWVP